MGQIRVTVKADVNDGDYIHQIIDVEESELDEYLDFIEMLKQEKSSNFKKINERILEESIDEEPCRWEDFIDRFMPYFSEYEIHTIESITYCKTPTVDYELLF